MYQQLGKSINCFIHKKQRATHICTDLNCHQNPIICSFCMSDGKYRTAHVSHDFAVRQINEGVQAFANLIRQQLKPMQNIFSRSVGNRQHQSLRVNLQKGILLMQQLQARIQSLKIQMDLQIELLFKQFQKQVLLQKQQCTRKLEQYKKVFANNVELLRRECGEIISFQNILKFYYNPNNLHLKLANQTERKSVDWFVKQKKTMLAVGIILENPNFVNGLNQVLNKVSKSNIMLLPFWKGGERTQQQAQRQLKALIKNHSNTWIQVPQINELQNKGQSIAYKYIQNYYQLAN